MKEALEKAQADISFQFFLARLFGEPAKAVDSGTEVHGYFWRDSMYVTKVVHPNPNPDSQHRSSPDF